MPRQNLKRVVEVSSSSATSSEDEAAVAVPPAFEEPWSSNASDGPEPPPLPTQPPVKPPRKLVILATPAGVSVRAAGTATSPAKTRSSDPAPASSARAGVRASGALVRNLGPVWDERWASVYPDLEGHTYSDGTAGCYCRPCGWNSPLKRKRVTRHVALQSHRFAQEARAGESLDEARAHFRELGGGGGDAAGGGRHHHRDPGGAHAAAGRWDSSLVWMHSSSGESERQ